MGPITHPPATPQKENNIKVFRKINLVGVISVVAMTVVSSGTDVLSTTCPVYQITWNVTEERQGKKVDSFLSTSPNCLRHYSLTTREIQKLTRAGVLVVTNVGMDKFRGTLVKEANPRLRVMDSAASIEDVLQSAAKKDRHFHARNRKRTGCHSAQSRLRHQGVPAQVSVLVSK